MDNNEQIRERILEAAEARFRHYGFQKTTMAEIAGDCQMSAANLYRFYENKRDIGAAFAARLLKSSEQALRQVVRTPGKTASELLEAFVLKVLHLSYNLHVTHSKLNEMIDVICSDCCELMPRHIEAKHALIAEILAEGNRTGEFDVKDVVAKAEAICAAVVQFSMPACMAMYQLEKLERLAGRVVSLLLEGLEKR